jgi:hypothetical protein
VHLKIILHTNILSAPQSEANPERHLKASAQKEDIHLHLRVLCYDPVVDHKLGRDSR